MGRVPASSLTVHFWIAFDTNSGRLSERNERGRAASVHEAGESVVDAARPDAAGDVDGETLARPFVDDGEAFELLAVRAGVERSGAIKTASWRW
jgi:hypothetical protein